MAMQISISCSQGEARNLLEVKVNSGTENCMLPLIAYRMMFPNNLIAGGLPKPDTLQSVTHIILDSYTDSILPVFGTVILKVAHYWTGTLMPVHFFVVDIKNKIIISHAVRTQLGLLSIMVQESNTVEALVLLQKTDITTRKHINKSNSSSFTRP